MVGFSLHGKEDGNWKLEGGREIAIANRYYREEGEGDEFSISDIPVTGKSVSFLLQKGEKGEKIRKRANFESLEPSANRNVSGTRFLNFLFSLSVPSVPLW